MTSKQKTRYNDTFNKKDSMDLNQSSNVLALITELKKICNYDDESNESGKLNHIKEILDELYPDGLVKLGDINQLKDRVIKISDTNYPYPKENTFTSEKMINKTLDLYNQLLSK